MNTSDIASNIFKDLKKMNSKIVYIIFIFTLLMCNVNTYGQGKVSRPTQQSYTSKSHKSNAKKSHKSNAKVTVSDPDGYINGHGYVDLGLPSGTKWATCNIGAPMPNKAGNYYSWGEVDIKETYTDDVCITLNKKILNFSGNDIYDVATKLWGDQWCMPSSVHTEELVNMCKWTWVNYNGQTGYKIEGPNGKNIFLPAAGWKDGRELKYCGPHGFIWTSTPSSTLYGSEALNFYKGQDDNIENCYYLYRRIGANIRPIIKN